MEKLVEKGKSKFVGPEIMGKNLGVIGLGAVGVKVANAAVKLGMNVYGYDPYLSVQNALVLDSSVKVVDLKTIYEMSDYITVHSPLLPSTKGMINEASISSMTLWRSDHQPGPGRPGGRRGYAGCSGKRQGCPLCHRLPRQQACVGKPGVVTIPHLGASTPESEENCAVMAAQELREYLNTGNIRNSVNMPNVEMPRTGAARLGIIHRNIPKMISNISTLLSAEGANIENMTNKSRGDYAYTLIDLGQEISEETLSHVRALEGVLRLRIIK